MLKMTLECTKIVPIFLFCKLEIKFPMQKIDGGVVSNKVKFLIFACRL